MNHNRLLLMIIGFAVLFMFTLVAVAPVTAKEKDKAKTESFKKGKKIAKDVKKEVKKKTKKKTEKAEKAFKAAKGKKPLPTGKININKADEKTLMMLPGIGPKKAAAIIKARKAGKFMGTEDLLKVKGIGKGILKKMSPYVKVK